MFEWLKPSSKKLKNPENLAKEVLELLIQEFERVEDPQLANDLLRYVVDGEDDGVLLRLKAVPDIAKKLRTVTSQTYSQARRRSHQRINIYINPEVPASFAYRLVQVVHAAFETSGQPIQWQHIPIDLAWVETFFAELTGYNVPNHRLENNVRMEIEFIQAVLKEGGLPESFLAELVFLEKPGQFHYYGYFKQEYFYQVKGIRDYLASQPEVLLRALEDPDLSHRIHVLERIAQKKVLPREPTLKRVLAMGLSNAKTERAAAQKVFSFLRDSLSDWLVPQLERIILEGSANEQFHALNWLWQVQGQTCTPLLNRALEQTKSKKVRLEIEKLLHLSQPLEAEKAGEPKDEFNLPEAKTYSTDYHLPDGFEGALRGALERYNQRAIEAHAKAWDRMDPKWRRGERTLDPPLNPSRIKLFVGCVMKSEVALSDRTSAKMNHQYLFKDLLHRELIEFARTQKLSLVPFLRLAFLADLFGYRSHFFISEHPFLEYLKDYRREHEPGLTLLDLANAFQAAKFDPEWVGDMYVTYSWAHDFNPLDLPNDAIWPYFHLFPHKLDVALGLSPRNDPDWYWAGEETKRAYQILATFPQPPSRYLALLWEKALGPGKTERPMAQACLIHAADRDTMILKALEDGRKDVRANAAAWLGKLNARETEPVLQKVLKKEKNDEVKAAIMSSLESFGTDLDKFLNRKALLDDAQKALRKPTPKDIAWFPFDQLPQMVWEKANRKVEPEIIQYFILQAFRFKNPEPNPLIQRYLMLMRAEDRQKLGELVFNSWLVQDTLPRYTSDEARQMAEKDLAQVKVWAARSPQYYQDFNEAQYLKASYNRYLNECLGSAISSKGILSIAAICCGPEIVPRVEKYVRTWFGHRMAQSKVLLRFLSWIDHPLAIQLILSISTRFRTRGIQQEATLLADEIASRKGWTRDEMADRTIPDAGFDRDGKQVIDYGARQFIATLQDDFSIQLTNADGKTIKDLPNANKAEDEEEIKLIKKEFTASKKELKQVLKLQQERLYEAMCTQRTWLFEDWNRYLNLHPIMGRYCQRLVWVASRDQAIFTTFRPMEDRSLTDVEDNEVHLKDDDLISIAHQSVLEPALAHAWLEHLQDYEVQPLFIQFGRKTFELTPELVKKTAIESFEGHLINSFKLRSIAQKLGYSRGSAEDGGWFYTYFKSFPSLKIQAVIEFSGNVLPEENRTVALISLYFIRLQEEQAESYAYAHQPLALKQVNQVILSECWNDLKQIADSGMGYDPDWQKKSAY
ncbi:MAG: DUF4132 domain-containing protein [Acidobacteria bacterium]|nr:DUF4132 domain-containing protein [Acidobacteriota bacterium]